MKRLLAVLIVLGGCMAVAQEEELKLPEGPGKKELERICTKCHDLEGFVHTRNTKQRWENVVDEMVSRGAEGKDEELDLIIEYLGKNFGRINLNKAPAEDLASGLSISKENAAAIVAYREKNGPYKVWQDLEKVPGLDMKKLQDKKGYVEF